MSHLEFLDIEHYRHEGYAVIERVYTADECEAFVGYMLDLQAGRVELAGFGSRDNEEWQRTHNQHWYDPMARRWLIEPRLQLPLRRCLDDEPEGIQTMNFWVGSEQGRHQDQFYLPGCISAWIALQDVDVSNGAMLVQPGSHKRRLLTTDDFAEGAEFAGWDYNAAVDVLWERNGSVEVAVEVKQGDVVFFDGVLVHRGGPILKRGSFRHALANHYIPRGLSDWPHVRWPRVAFDGSERHYPLPETA